MPLPTSTDQYQFYYQLLKSKVLTSSDTSVTHKALTSSDTTSTTVQVH